MRTVSKVHDRAQRAAQRLQGECMAQRSMLRLWAVVSILRTAFTQLLPLAGSAGWWMIPVCLLPGTAVWYFFAQVMKRTGVAVLTDALRTLMGKAGAAVLYGILAVGMLLDGAASMTALVTFFTEGIGTEGTQMTLAVLTAGVLAFCLSREGLPRGIFLLRWVLLAALTLVAADALGQAKADHAFPVLGDGTDAIWEGVLAGVGLGWPLTILLISEPVKPEKRLRDAAPVLFLCTATTTIAVLSMPHEQLTQIRGLAGGWLNILRPLQPAVGTMGECLLMLGLFLAIGAAVLLTAEMIAAPLRAKGRFLPFGVLAVLTASQWLDVDRLWILLSRAQMWLMGGLALLSAVAWGMSLIRRKRA